MRSQQLSGDLSAWYARMDGHAPLLLAGLYDTWQDDAKGAEPLESAWQHFISDSEHCI